MFGSIMRVRCTSDDGAHELLEHAKGYQEHQQDSGLLWTEVAQAEDDPRDVFAVIHFRDREAYRANAESPATKEWYEKLLTLIDGEPHWHDVNFLGIAGEVPQGAVRK